MSGANTFLPLRTATFRNIWVASLVANTGFLIQSVGSAWAMAGMAPADMVAMVQTATFLPMALFAIPAGAIADMYDRRKAQMISLSLALLAAALMTLVSALGLMSPWTLLGFCFLVGSGVAFFGPAWQSAVGEQVPPSILPQAVALNGISYNIARSFGPAVGGLIVAALGVTAAFAINALFYLPILFALYAWRRVVEPSRLPPEGLPRAVVSGLRYIANMLPVRRAVMRSFVSGLLGAALLSLMPLVSRDLLGGGATTFGVLLGCFGIGAVGGIFVLEPLRAFSNEMVVRGCSLVLAASAAVMACSGSLLLTSLVLVAAGTSWMMLMTIVAIALQLLVPRWVVGRAVATMQATTALGIAAGSWAWGTVARDHGVATALLIAAVLLLLSPLLGIFLRIADRTASAETVEGALDDPDVKLGITGRSGPISIEVQYRIPAERARDFYNLMREVQGIRSRNGAYDWALSRDIADPEVWCERYRCPTWNDYLRQRERRTVEEAEIQKRAMDLHFGLEPVRVKRWLDRPSGSVRWSAETPDRGDAQLPLTGS